MKCRFLLFWVFLLVVAAAAQELGDWVESSADPQELQAWWDDLRQNPLDLNRAASDEIARLPLFDRAAALAVTSARRERGGFSSLDDVLSLASLTDGQRNVLRELTTVEPLRGPRADISAFCTAGGRSDAHFYPASWSSRLRAIFRGERQHAYLFGVREAGTPDLLAETSLGVEFTQSSAGTRWLIGDYQCETGTGLVFASPFGTAQWLASYEALGPGEARGLGLRPSGNRRLLMRGAAVEIRRGPLDAVLVGDWSRRDAALGDSGAERLAEGEPVSSEELAVAREGQMEERLAGASAEVKMAGLRVGVTGYASQFNPALVPHRDQAVPELQGSHLRVGSVFASAGGAGLNLTSEIAASNPGGAAAQTALSFRGDQMGLSLYHVRADEDFFSPHSVQWDGFGSAAKNAEMIGARIRAIWPRHSLTAAFSSSRTPFRTATSPLAKSASSLEMHWRAALTTGSEVHLKLFRRYSEKAAESEPAQGVMTDGARAELRLGNERQSLHGRCEVRSARREGDTDRKLGSLLFVQGARRTRWVEMTARLTFYHLENADVSMSVYELPLRGEYPLVTLAGSGERATLMMAREWRALSVAAKIAHGRKSLLKGDRDELSLGLEFTYRR
jgi:hypothetical protein